MEKHLIFDTSSNTRHDYIDAHGETYTLDYIQDATPFESLEDAQAYIDRNKWQDWAVPTPAPTNEMEPDDDFIPYVLNDNAALDRGYAINPNEYTPKRKDH